MIFKEKTKYTEWENQLFTEIHSRLAEAAFNVRNQEQIFTPINKAREYLKELQFEGYKANLEIHKWT